MARLTGGIYVVVNTYKSKGVTSSESSAQEICHAQYNDPGRCHWGILKKAYSSVGVCILSADDNQLQICYLEAHELFQHVKVQVTY